MKIYSEKSVVTETLTDVRCNACGRYLRKDEFGYFEDYVSLSKTWGYSSPLDGETHAFDLCFDCYRGITDSFTIPVCEKE